MLLGVSLFDQWCRNCASGLQSLWSSIVYFPPKRMPPTLITRSQMQALPSSVLPNLAALSNGVLRGQSPLTKLTTKTTRNDTTRNELEACGNDIVPSVESGGRRALPHRQVLYQNYKPEEHSSGFRHWQCWSLLHPFRHPQLLRLCLEHLRVPARHLHQV